MRSSPTILLDGGSTPFKRRPRIALNRVRLIGAQDPESRMDTDLQAKGSVEKNLTFSFPISQISEWLVELLTVIPFATIIATSGLSAAECQPIRRSRFNSNSTHDLESRADQAYAALRDIALYHHAQQAPNDPTEKIQRKVKD